MNREASEHHDGCEGDRNRRQVEYAVAAIEQMAAEAARGNQCGTIGVEITIKDGQLGKVKLTKILFQQQ